MIFIRSKIAPCGSNMKFQSIVAIVDFVHMCGLPLWAETESFVIFTPAAIDKEALSLLSDMLTPVPTLINFVTILF